MARQHLHDQYLRSGFRASCAVQFTQKSIASPTHVTARRMPRSRMARQPGRRPAIGLDEAGIAVDVAAVALADDRLGVGQIEAGVEFGALRALHAIVHAQSTCGP